MGWIRTTREQPSICSWRRGYADLRRTAYRLTGNWATAEDLVRTSLAETWLTWGSIRDLGAGEAYARKVMATTTGSLDIPGGGRAVAAVQLARPHGWRKRAGRR